MFADSGVIVDHVFHAEVVDGEDEQHNHDDGEEYAKVYASEDGFLREVVHGCESGAYNHDDAEYEAQHEAYGHEADNEFKEAGEVFVGCLMVEQAEQSHVEPYHEYQGDNAEGAT